MVHVLVVCSFHRKFDAIIPKISKCSVDRTPMFVGWGPYVWHLQSLFVAKTNPNLSWMLYLPLHSSVIPSRYTSCVIFLISPCTIWWFKLPKSPMLAGEMSSIHSCWNPPRFSRELTLFCQWNTAPAPDLSRAPHLGRRWWPPCNRPESRRGCGSNSSCSGQNLVDQPTKTKGCYGDRLDIRFKKTERM